MPLPRRILARWVQLAALATALSIMVYLAVQQVGRQSANDPQLQIARDASAAVVDGKAPAIIASEPTIDIAESLAPWITVTDDQGKIIASSARLHGNARTLPRGVFDHARASGETRVTWQPEPGVRMATVVVHNRNGGFIVAGRSLRESEERTAAYGRLILLGWLATLTGLLAVVSATEALMPSRMVTA